MDVLWHDGPVFGTNQMCDACRTHAHKSQSSEGGKPLTSASGGRTERDPRDNVRLPDVALPLHPVLERVDRGLGSLLDVLAGAAERPLQSSRMRPTAMRQDREGPHGYS